MGSFSSFKGPAHSKPKGRECDLAPSPCLRALRGSREVPSKMPRRDMTAWEVAESASFLRVEAEHPQAGHAP